MRVKNVSKKVIGNQSFRILPGESMDVNGNELWVQMYLADGKLTEEEIRTEEAESVEERSEEDETPPETGAADQDGTETRKKGGRRKAESAE